MWAKNFIDQPSDTQVPSQFVCKNSEKDQEWVSRKPDLKDPAPTLKEIAKNLTAHYEETAHLIQTIVWTVKSLACLIIRILS